MTSSQPNPKPNGSTPLFRAVQDDIAERAEYGKQQYGTHLQAANGRDALQDAYEEALDLVVYLKQALVEREQNRIEWRRTVDAPDTWFTLEH